MPPSWRLPRGNTVSTGSVGTGQSIVRLVTTATPLSFHRIRVHKVIPPAPPYPRLSSAETRRRRVHVQVKKQPARAGGRPGPFTGDQVRDGGIVGISL